MVAPSPAPKNSFGKSAIGSKEKLNKSTRKNEIVDESEKENEESERRPFNDKKCENVEEADYSGDESKSTGENDISRGGGNKQRRRY